MKKSRRLLGIIILLISFFSGANAQSDFGIEKNIIISGTIIDYDIEKSPQTITIIRRDFFDLDKSYVENIDKDGRFKFKFPIAYIQELWLRYGEPISLLCIPDDSLYIQIDNKILQDGKSLAYLKFPDTKTGKTNFLINKFNEELLELNVMRSQEAETNKSPKEFKDYIKKREQIYYTFLEKFNKENQTTELFDQWVGDKLKYESWNDLMRYRWTHSYYNKMKDGRFNFPESYFAFLRDYNMNDNRLFSIAHADFLHEFSIYLDQNQKVSLIKGISMYRMYQKQEYKKLWGIMKSRIEVNASGFTRDLFYAESYVDLLKGQDIKMFEAVYDSGFTKQSYFLKIINKEYQQLKNYLSNQNTGSANLSTIKSPIVAGLMDTICQKYKGKVIYIDFWAPWCGPCMKEMPYSKEIQEYFKNDKVVFLFLANGCKEDSWKATIANKKLTGEHILLTDDQFNVLSGLLGFNGIPHYTLIDTMGNIVLKNAPRPSDKDQVIEAIKKQMGK